MQTLEHRFNADNLPPKLEAVYRAVLAALHDLPFCYYPSKSGRLAEAAASKIAALARQCGLQSVMNEYFGQQADELSFTREAPVHFADGLPPDNRKIDFARWVDGLRICMEMEFGNLARLDSDISKLSNAFLRGACHLGIIICPVAATSSAITGGGATFESLVARVKGLHPSLVPGPLILIGLSHEGAELVDLSTSKIGNPDLLSGNNGREVCAYVVKRLRRGDSPEDIELPDTMLTLHDNRPALVRHEELQASLF